MPGGRNGSNPGIQERKKLGVRFDGAKRDYVQRRGVQVVVIIVRFASLWASTFVKLECWRRIFVSGPCSFMVFARFRPSRIRSAAAFPACKASSISLA